MGELAHPVKIRGHHLLCLLGFRGRGYSPEFVTTMGSVLTEFRTNLQTPILPVTECDVICRSCPYQIDHACRKSPESEKRIKDKDAAILVKAGIRPNARTTPQKAWDSIKLHFTPEDLTELCSRCQWFELGYCQEGLAKLINGAENPQ